MEGSASWGTQDVMRSVPFKTTVTIFTRQKKIIPVNHEIAMAGGTFRFTLATIETAGKTLSVTDTSRKRDQSPLQNHGNHSRVLASESNGKFCNRIRYVLSYFVDK